MAENTNLPGASTNFDAEDTLERVLNEVVSHDASDLHISVGLKPIIRIDGELHSVADTPILTAETAQALVYEMISDDQRKKFEQTKELDFSLAFENKARFRVNVFYQHGTVAAALRLIPTKIRTYQELDLPPKIQSFAEMKQGLVLFAGPTGHGKSTSQAAIIDDINTNRAEHIITIEDPVEYAHRSKKSIIDQREVGMDTLTFANALRAVLREDPDIVLIGEMRDPETMASAMTIAETGHLVFATIHTNDAPQTVDRIIDSFQPHQQNQIRAQLAQVLTAVVSQRLLPRIGGGRIPSVEIMVATNAIRSMIREGKTHQIPGAIQTASEEGMVSMEKALAERIQQGLVKYEDAVRWVSDEKTLNKLVKGY